MVPLIRESLKLELLIQLGHYAQLNPTSESSRIKDSQSKVGQEAKERKKLVHQYRICFFFNLMSLLYSPLS